MKKIKTFCAISASLALIVSMFVTAFAASSIGIEGPCYVILSPTGLSEEIAVTWWDVPEAAEGYVRYSTAPLEGDEAHESFETTVGVRNRVDTTNGYAAFEARMTGLSNGTTYYYCVGNGEQWSEVYSFVFDSGDDDGNAAFLYLGDIQYSNFNNAEADLAAWGALVQGAVESNPNIGFGVLGGDMVQQGQSATDWQRFFSHAGRVFNELPLLAVPGNHESNSMSGKPQMYLDVMALPENGPAGFTEEFYSFDYGNCHIVALSSQIFAYEQLAYGSMTEDDFDVIADWISDDLAASDATWKIVVLHHPVYGVVPDTVSAKVLENWAPVFEKAQVDLIFCGHQHIYMRTAPIRGVTQIMGNSGSQHYAPADVAYSEVMIGYTSNYQIVNADGTELTVASYDASGAMLDTVTLEAKDRSITPVWPEDTLDGDLNGDGIISGSDVEILLDAIRFFNAYNETMDINNDGKIDICDAHRLALRIVID